MIVFRHLRPVLWTQNIQESIKFYTEILQFNLDEFNEEWNWASLSKNEVGIMLAKPNEHEKFEKIGFTGSIYINIDDFDSLWGKLHNNVKICYSIYNFPWKMREFAIYDNNGYILQFGQDLL